MTLGLTRRRALGALGGLLAGPWLAGCSGGEDSDGAGAGSRNVVRMGENLAFEPPDLTVAAGERVIWVNDGSTPHTVTAYADRIPAGAAYFASGGFDSERAAREAYPPHGGLEGGVSYPHTFETPGSYEYFCVPHESGGMTGTITVRAAGAPE